MDLQTLFLETVDDLSARLQRPGTEYDAVMAAALLRKLLLDSPTLSDVVNTRRLKIRYVVNGRLPVWKELGEPPPTTYAVEDGLILRRLCGWRFQRQLAETGSFLRWSASTGARKLQPRT